MLTSVHPKLPMRDKAVTRDFYLNKLGFARFGDTDYDDYFMVFRDNVQLHFFLFEALDPRENYGQVYLRTDDIERLYESIPDKATLMPGPAYHLQTKPWGREFSLLDPDNNLLTFGETG